MATFYGTYLISKLHGHIYIGMTENITERIMQHNSGYNTSTKAFVPW
ncbi:MAG: GIY-YIG nuclease family protein [Saprospiraceae bacterium]|nr:GIY-YIG nuclease family protein [Saprospiraceae bacterium]